MGQISNTKVVLVVHGTYGRPLLDIAERITGPLNVDLLEIPQETTSPQLPVIITEEIDRHTASGDAVLLLSDLCGSTPANACLSLVAKHREWEMISGVNLAMLLKLSTCPRTMPPVELARQLRETGQKSIRMGREIMAAEHE